MSKEPKSTPKPTKKRSSTETARRIWLAGIGAYGRAFTEAQEAVKDVRGQSSEMFNDLVQKGEMLEMAVGMKSKKIIDKAGVPDFNIEDRVKAMRAKIKSAGDWAEDKILPGRDHGGHSSHDHDHPALEARLAAMDAKLDAVIAALSAGAAPKPVARTAAKPAAKKSAAKTPSSEKSASPKTASKTKTQRVTKPKV